MDIYIYIIALAVIAILLFIILLFIVLLIKEIHLVKEIQSKSPGSIAGFSKFHLVGYLLWEHPKWAPFVQPEEDILNLNQISTLPPPSTELPLIESSSAEDENIE